MRISFKANVELGRSPLTLVATGFFLVLAALTQTARATESSVRSDVPQLEEVVVTARRKEESEQRVAVAVNAFTAADIEKRGIESIEGIAMRSPGFVFVKQGVAAPQLYLRGVGSPNAIDAASESPVAVYVDEVYVGRVSGVDFGMYDLARVEVLRGPQGTLFGRNASGGVIQLGPVNTM